MVCANVCGGDFLTSECVEIYKDLSCHVYCPMIAAWPKGCTGNTHIEDSLFTEWLAASGYDKCFFAALIAEWGEYLLNELEEQSHENRQ